MEKRLRDRIEKRRFQWIDIKKRQFQGIGWGRGGLNFKKIGLRREGYKGKMEKQR